MRLRSRIPASVPAVRRATRRTAAITALLLAGALGLPAGPLTPRADAAAAATAPAPAGAGFTLNAGDLRFILEQIKVAERHAATATPANPCGTMLGSGPHQVPAPQLPYGLRTVDGSCNNLEPGQAAFGAAQQPMPRLAAPVFRGAEDADVPGLGPVGPPGPTSYAQRSGAVVDSRPRLISNLVADQTAANPAAVLAAGVPHRGFGSGPTAVPCTAPGVPGGCVPDGQTLPIPNVSTDAGLSPPFNSWFTLFGQFFDHGLDSTAKGGNGTVFVP